MRRYLWVEHRPARSEDALLRSALGVGEEWEQEVERRNGNESVRSYFI